MLVPVTLADDDPVSLPVAVALLELVPVMLPDCEPVALPVAVPLGERLPVPLAVLLTLPKPVPLALTELLPDALRVALPVPLALAVALALGVPDGLRSDATLRPRYVSRDTASSPLSPPPAASHSADSSTPLAKLLLGMSCVTLTYR